MTDALPWDFDERSDRLYIHFDVTDHHLKLDTFIRTAESARKVIDALDTTFFNGRLEYQMIVLPPAEGTFLSKLAIWVTSGAGAVFAAINTDVGAAYVEGLTGHTPSELAQTLGEDHRALFDRALSAYELLGSKGHETDNGKLSVDAIFDLVACRDAAKVVVAMTKGILEKNPAELLKLGMEFGALADAVDARADFFAACIDDPDVKRVGFTPEDEFPIPRHSFPERAVKPTRTSKEEEPPEWTVSEEGIYVTSPNWDKEDQKTRQWKGKDQGRRDCYFVIDDAEFWHHVKHKALRVDVLDNLKVQWAFQIADGRPKNRRVLRVLEFNGKRLAEPLPPAAIRAILGSYSTLDVSRRQSDLFG